MALLRPDGDIDPALLARMRDALAHRGPDAAEQWIEGPAGLAHRRLSIIDTSEHANQPMFSADRRLVLVFNGEIYNYLELREELTALGRPFRTQSDTEVLLQAIDHWGAAALPKLNGMFAFALWNRDARRLLVARDRFGEKPMFTTVLEDGGIAIASEMKALLHDPGVSDEIDPQTLADYTRGAYYEEGENTFFRAIKRFPAATAALIDETGKTLRSWRYWTPNYEAIDNSITEEAAIARFHELLERSVRMRLRADVPVGSSLSGGLDSSVVVGMLAKTRGSGQDFRQHTFSARFPEDPTMCEGPYIDQVVQATGVTSHTVTPTPEGLARESRTLHWHQEEPVLSASIYLQWCVARLAKQNGTVVQLDGQGADELLGGYQYWFRFHQADLLDKGEHRQLARTTAAFNTRLSEAASGYEDSNRRFNANAAYSVDEIAAMKSRNEPEPLYQGGPWTVGLPEPKAGMRARRIMAESMLYNSLPILLRYADRDSMAFSREARLPYLDYDLVDFCISLPDRMFFNDGWQKYILRKAGENYIPDSVAWRADKVGYAAPLDIWLRGPLKDWAYEKAFTGPVTAVAGYDSAALQALWDQHQSGAQNNSWAIWRWISLNEWLQIGEEGGWRHGPQKVAV